MLQEKKKKARGNEVAGSPHTGELLKRYYTDHRTHKAALARRLSRQPATVYHSQQQASMQTAILWDVSIALEHNFFSDIACLMPARFSTYATVDDTKDQQIAALQKQVDQLTAERDVLLKAFGK
jgi:hypothetical protein